MPASVAIRRMLRFLLLLLSDLTSLVFAYYASLWLRFDGDIPEQFLSRHPAAIALGLGVYILCFSYFRLYRCDWRFASVDIVFSVVAANTLGLVVASLFMWMIDMVSLPRSVIIMTWGCGILLVGTMRIVLRLLTGWIARRQQHHPFGSRRPISCLILGAGDEAVSASRLLRNQHRMNYQVLGVLDHRTPPAVGYYIFGMKILGGIEDFPTLVRELHVDEMIIALPQVDGVTIRKIAMECRSLGVTPRLIPSLDNSLNQPALDGLPEVTVEDLLRRDPVKVDLAIVQASLRDRTVLVTGAGGSIGSELCRQIMRQHPRKLLLLGHGENSIHRIHGELANAFPEMADRLAQVICDVRDTVNMEHLFAQERPEIVFHAAAHKHVPLMELNPGEAVKNNVGGTQTVARLAGQYGAERLLLISTDKAVAPTSIMGATKWVCEEIVRHLSAQYPQTRFITTRFGNVLGSRGSVVPIFREQIANGGPLTVTHPHMTRYFMTIPEAAQLVLAANAVGESGQVLVLDMGKPVAILELAREMIHLAGLEEGKDIKVVFTGMRPGEKLHEDLFGAHEEQLPTPNKGLFLAKRPQYLAPPRFREFVEQLLLTADHWDPDRVCATLASEMPSLRSVFHELAMPSMMPNPLPSMPRQAKDTEAA